MNPTTIDPTQPPPQPPQQTQPPRSSFSCDKHPHEQFTGFCPECLCERLTTLDNNSNNNPSSSSRRPSTSSIKSLFSKPAKPASFFPELRRTKSFSASKNEALEFVKASALEPQRKSCDVRGRNTLWSLFSIDDETKSTGKPKPTCSQNANNEDSGFVGVPVKEEEEEEPENVVDEITSPVDNELEPEIVVEDVHADILKPRKDHIDLDSQTKKAAKKERFWSAASVFSKKWQNWRKKHKLKKRNNGENSGNFNLPVSKPISRRYNNRDTQSEIADYGFGRRSCDTDPRFSLDAGRISFDDPRYSFDEPRASWDGYLIGNGRSNFPRMPPMVSLIEDAPIVQIPRFDGQIPVEEPRFSVTSINEDEPGGSTQTKEYYSDSSSRRRKSLDRSNSIRKTAAAVVAEIDNAKVLPAMVGDQFLGAKVLVGGERDLNSNSNSNSLRDDCSETFELTGFRDNGGSMNGNGERKESKKSKRWAWNLWGFIHRRVSGNKENEEDDRYSRSINGVERSFSESWQDLRTNGDVRGGSINRKVFRSNSSVNWRNSNGIGGSFGGSVRKSGVEMNGGNAKKKRDDFVLERNRSARYSPTNHIDNGLLRFYLTPMRGSRRGLPGKSRPNGSHSIARSLLRLY
ncbi:protein OCTOPUS-like [Lycium barbarum]|uniref:protein OCTOPUS-like n=1 Tax=Lycium barbarum TaxID=112863 RepID=UPI00293F1B0E|nr:protein OCTOPUS-like [Lycium barbarum]